MRTFQPALVFLAFAPLLTAASAQPPIPNESFDYAINWPSGLSLGEAHWKAQNTGTAAAPEWTIDFDVDARIPGFALIDTFHSQSTGSYCTEEFKRDLAHGSRKSGETIDVDSQVGMATRKPIKGGGESTMKVPECVHDPLAYLFFARRELLAGRIVPDQSVLYGSLYQVKLAYLGAGKVQSNDRSIDADHVSLDIQGPSSHITADAYFARDALRTPVSIRIPLPLGSFSLELTH